LAFAGLTAYTFGGLEGTGTGASFTLANSDGNAVALTIGNDLNLSSAAAFSGTLSGAGSLIKAGTGTFLLGGTSTFSGGLRVAGGTLALNSSSTPISPVSAGLGQVVFTNGPVGSSTLTLASDTRLSVSNNLTSTLANALVLEGATSFFTKVSGANASTILLNGAITPTLSSGALAVDVADSLLSVNWAGALTNAALVTSLTKTGLGNFGVNLTGVSSSAPLSFSGGTTLTLYADGNGGVASETLNIGATSFTPVVSIGTINIGRSGQTALWNQSLNKTIAPELNDGQPQKRVDRQ
jgi:autotransporter-associated beta strand protein